MIEKMENHLIALKKPISRLNAQAHAQQFYEQLGYRVISEPFEVVNIMHITMEKKLT